MSKKGARRTCEICGIKEAHLENPLFFANFPLDENRCREWVRVTGNSDLVNLPIEKLYTLKHVCGRHFKSKDLNKKGNRLKKRAVPCLNLMTNPLSDHEMSEFPLHMAKTQDFQMPSTSKETGQTNAACSMVDGGSLEKDIQMPSTSKETRQTHAACSSVVDGGSLEKDIQMPSTSKETRQTHAACSSVVDGGSLEKENTDTSKKAYDVEMEAKGVKRKHLNYEENFEAEKKRCEAHPEEVEAKDVNRTISNYEDLTPRKKKLIKKLKETRCTLRSLRRSSKLLEKIESPVLKELVINACKNEKRKPKARRWTTQHKLSCLAILKRSQKAYRYLSAAVPLPTIKTLQNILKKVPMVPGISQSVLNHLKTIADGRDEKDRVCSLAFDEMAIKSRLIYNEASDLVVFTSILVTRKIVFIDKKNKCMQVFYLSLNCFESK